MGLAWTSEDAHTKGVGNEDKSRRGRGLLLIAFGLVLLGLELRWRGGVESLVFSGKLWGAGLFELQPDELRAAAQRLAPGVGPSPLDLGDPWTLLGWAWLALALAFGAAWVAPRLVSASPSLKVRGAAAFATVLALSPWLALFIATRTPLGATAYLGLEDQTHALGLGLVLLGLVPIFRTKSPVPPSDRVRAGLDGPRSLAGAVVASVLLPFALSLGFLGGKPLTNDGVAYQFQAELFAAGELESDVGPLPDFFPARQILPGPRATSKYPPGHSLTLAAGSALGLPRLFVFLLAGLSTLLTFHLARRLGARSPGAAAWVFALSPMVLGVGSLWLSHGTSLPMGLIFLVAWLAAWDGKAGLFGVPSWALAALAGFALSWAFDARPLTAVALAVPVAFAGLGGLDRRRIGLVLAAFLGFLPGLVFFLFVNHELTGSALRPVYDLYAERMSPNDRWGLVNLATLLPYTAYNLARLSAWLVGAGAAGWLLIFAWHTARPKHHAHLVWSLPLSLVAFYSLHRFQGIPWVGPLYLVEALPALAVLAGGGLVVLFERLRLSPRLIPLALLASSAVLLLPHLSLASSEAELRQAPRTAAERFYHAISDTPLLVFVPLRTPAELKRHPLPPPLFTADPATGRLLPSRWPVVARDLGPVRNAELLALLGGEVTVRRWDPKAGALLESDAIEGREATQ